MPRALQILPTRTDISASDLIPPLYLVRLAVASVWIYEGLWCKVLRRAPDELRVVQAVPLYGPRFGGAFLLGLGWIELALGLWVLSGIAPVTCALAQTVLLASLNGAGLLFSRHIIHDPAGMVVKNFAFLVLAWVNAGLSR